MSGQDHPQPEQNQIEDDNFDQAIAPGPVAVQLAQAQIDLINSSSL
jgi:hypothetical protein